MAITMIETTREVDEHGVQVMLFQWMALVNAPGARGKIADYAWMIPNGLYLGSGSAAKRAAYINKMKRAGFKPGVADVAINLPLHGMHGALLELKRKMTPGRARSATSDDQRDHLCRMYNVGYFVGVAAGFDQAKAAVMSYMNGGRVYNLDLFGELQEDGSASPIQSKRKRSKSHQNA